MRKRFPGYYQPTKEEFAVLWKTALFVPDTNILLHFFRLGENTRNEVISTLRLLTTRLWIPYQVGVEFQKRWRDVEYKSRAAYEDLTRRVKASALSLQGLFNEYTRHQIIDVETEKKKIDDFFSDFCNNIKSLQAKHPSLEDSQKIFIQISELIGEGVGEKPKRTSAYDGHRPRRFRPGGEGV